METIEITSEKTVNLENNIPSVEYVLNYKDVELYQKDQLILHDVNFEIQRGEFIYLIGKTGSGKSTLLKSIYGEIPIRKGEAIVCEQNLNKIKRSKIPFLRRNLGMIFQDFRLLEDRSIFENLSFVLRATGWKNKIDIKDKVEKALSEVGLEYKANKFPQELSGGESQRVAIARALLNNPKLILADEPTANLDPETANEIFNLMIKLRKSHKAAILVATHDYRLLQDFPARIIKCAEGKISCY